MLRDPIGGTWTHSHSNFDLWPSARLNIFGYYTQVHTTLRDQLRVGHLWGNYGNWNGVQVAPENYLREATVTNDFILENEPEENWKYGMDSGAMIAGCSGKMRREILLLHRAQVRSISGCARVWGWSSRKIQVCGISSEKSRIRSGARMR